MKDKKTLVLGASTKPERYAYLALNRLAQKEIPTVAIGLKEGNVAGISIDTGMPNYKDVDTVTLYLGARHQTQYYDYLLSLNPKRVIFNPGTQNPELKALLEENGIKTSLACTLVLLGTDQY